MAQDAITGYLQSLRKHGKPIPTDNDSFIAITEVSLGEGKLKKVSYA